MRATRCAVVSAIGSTAQIVMFRSGMRCLSANCRRIQISRTAVLSTDPRLVPQPADTTGTMSAARHRSVRCLRATRKTARESKKRGGAGIGEKRMEWDMPAFGREIAHIDLGNDPANCAPRNLERRTNPDPRFISRPWSCSSQAARFSLLTSASATRFSCTIDGLVTRRRLFSLQGGLFRHDRVHIVSCPEIAAARPRDERPSFRRLVSVGREHQSNRDALRLHRHFAQKRTNRSVGKNTSRHSLAFRHQFSPHLQGIQRPRRIERHDVCGSRGNDTGPPGMGVPKPQFGHCRKHNRP